MYTKEQIQQAKSIDLLTYLQMHEPGNLIKTGTRSYVTKEHDSLVIKDGFWFWNS